MKLINAYRQKDNYYKIYIHKIQNFRDIFLIDKQIYK